MASLKKRGKTYYLKFYEGGQHQREISLRTDSLQIAKEKKRQFESAQARGVDNPLPGRTPITQVLDAYVKHIRAIKTAKSAQNDIYYLREVFGPICEGLIITSRKTPVRPRKQVKAGKGKVDRRRKAPAIQASHFEAISTQQIAEFIDTKVRDYGIAPKTANHYRSILRRLFNWSTEQHGIKLPGNINPAAKVKPYKERAWVIRYLTLPQIDTQLDALRFNPKLQTMVAFLIYAGLRREELLWLTLDDVDTSRRACRNGGQGLIRIQAKTAYMGTDKEQFWQPKTGINRVVPISRALRGYLDAYTPAPSDGSWFFPSFEGALIEPDNFSARMLKKANDNASLPWTCLDFRHTFGSQLAQNGVSLFKIATLMGNSPEIVRKHYASLIPEAMAAEVEFGEPVAVERKQA